MSKEEQANPYAALERVFHEPGRLAIMSELMNHNSGLLFAELRSACELTDGNLNRHLKTLAEAGAVKISKRFVGGKPQTRAQVTAKGREGFMRYLQALEKVLMQAAQALNPEQQKSMDIFPALRPTES